MARVRLPHLQPKNKKAHIYMGFFLVLMKAKSKVFELLLISKRPPKHTC